jgi:hypothetical protein
MILEVAILDVRSGQEGAFESTFASASKIIASMSGYVSHDLQRCLERSNRYVLLVNWKTTRSASANRLSIKSGKRCCITSTIRSRPWNIINACNSAVHQSRGRRRGSVNGDRSHDA